MIIDLRPPSFAEESRGKAVFAKSVFKARQSVPFGMEINPKSYLPTRTAIDKSMEDLLAEWEQNFILKLQTDIIDGDVAISIAGGTLKAQGRHFFDFTMHHFGIQRGKQFYHRQRFESKRVLYYS